MDKILSVCEFATMGFCLAQIVIISIQKKVSLLTAIMGWLIAAIWVVIARRARNAR
jgi:hypothetical protein